MTIGSWSQKTVESRPSLACFTWGTFDQASQTWQLRSAYAEHWGQEPETWDIKTTNQNVVLQKGGGRKMVFLGGPELYSTSCLNQHLGRFDLQYIVLSNLDNPICLLEDFFA